jgi:hypothetical protein
MRVATMTLLVMLFLFLGGCLPDPEWSHTINVPHFESTTNFSGAHCIAMWSAYDNKWINEEIIAMSISPVEGYTQLCSMEEAIFMYTNSVGILSEFPNTDDGQNKALSVASISLKYLCPSILPMALNTYWLVNGARGYYDGYRKVADKMRYHFFNYNNRWMYAADLKCGFRNIGGRFFALIGDRLFENEGVDKYLIFKSEGGTYEGAPLNYKPGDNFTSIQ